jgi:hypothetical protein
VSESTRTGVDHLVVTLFPQPHRGRQQPRSATTPSPSMALRPLVRGRPEVRDGQPADVYDYLKNLAGGGRVGSSHLVETGWREGRMAPRRAESSCDSRGSSLMERGRRRLWGRRSCTTSTGGINPPLAGT